MKYHLTRLKIFFSRFFGRILNFFDAVAYYTRKYIFIIRTHERTQNAKYHITKASKRIVSSGRENAWNWSHRLASSESFKIFDEEI